MTASEAHDSGATGAFDDLLANNREFAKHFDQQGFDGVAHAGVLMVTCMDSRIVPLQMVGLTFGDAKIIRTPGGRVTTSAMAGCIAGVHLLQVDRIMVIPHSRCAMAAADDEVLIERIRKSSGADASWIRFGASADQRRTLSRDVEKLRNHPLISDRAVIGGFYYDVDTGLLERWV
jgi:carbonic anhydrase